MCLCVQTVHACVYAYLYVRSGASATASGKEARPGAAGKSTSPAPDVSLCGRSVADGGLSVQEAQASAAAAISFRPVLLLVPLRLGLDKFEGRYTQPLLVSLLS